MLKSISFYRLYTSCCPLRTSIAKHHVIGRRTFLSESYRCQEAWDKRLQAPIIQNVKLDEFYYEMDLKYNQKERVNAIDLDLFANAVNEESHLDQLEDLVHKLRLTDAAQTIFPSTSHALIRLFLQFEKHEDLLRILDDRINYGVFSDYFCSCLMMDTFVKNKDYSSAARVAVLHMLQEDWDDPLVKALAIYSCHMYLREPNESNWVEPVKEEVKDTGEEELVRVRFLRKYFFDDHFDIRSPKLLLGKTLASLGAIQQDEIGRTFQLIGWAMYNKWSKVEKLLENFKNQEGNRVLYKYGVEKVGSVLQEALAAENVEDKETLNKVSNLLQDPGLTSKTLGDDPHEVVVNNVLQTVKETEKVHIEQQHKTYQDWQAHREEQLNKYLAEEERLRRLQEVESKKEDLRQRENVIFYFDNIVEWNRRAEKNKALLAEKEAFEKERYRNKASSAKDEEYIPPEIIKRKQN